jgi:predicted HicB family RNase H-like nuclease
MPVSHKKVAVSKFPLRLMLSVRRLAENFSQKEGISLNQFINVAVAEKLAHLQHEEWLGRPPRLLML